MIELALVWSLYVTWHGGTPLGSGREWLIVPAVDLRTCEAIARTVTGPIEKIECRRP